MKNLNLLATPLKCLDKVPHGDTLNYLLKGIPSKYIATLRTEMVRTLIRKKCFVNDRLGGRYYLIVIDGTWMLNFNKRHCKGCLKRAINEDKYIYYHPVLEAKLITVNGMAVSIATEFIENAGSSSKQDCELKAFYRLAKRLKADFPQMKICIAADALYAAKPVFDICEKYHWKYIITFKEGSMPATYAEFENLKEIEPGNKENFTTAKTVQNYQWITEINYEGHSLDILECVEANRKNNKATKFVWLTNLPIKSANILQIAQGGRARWKIENEGFNMQKNGGYGLEHAYSLNTEAMKNFYFLLQIAHIISQLMEKGNLLKDSLLKTYGSIKNFSLALWRAFVSKSLNPDEIDELLNTRIQIRFNTS
ncbi:MAG: transposase [Armatimonadota bacterium]